MKNRNETGYEWIVIPVILLSVAVLTAACGSLERSGAGNGSRRAPLEMRSTMNDAHPPAGMVVTEPPDGAVYPADLAAPLFQWNGPEDGRWLIELSPPSRQGPLHLAAFNNPWVPSREDWERIKGLAPGQPLEMSITHLIGDQAATRGKVSFIVSREPLDARVIYQEIPVPFRFAERNVDRFRWRSFSPNAQTPPRTVMTGLQYCANCHTFSRDGSTFGLDIDYRGDRGGYISAGVSDRMDLRKSDVFSWNDYLPGQGGISRGLFAKISPGGDYVMATVKERPFLVRIDDPAYSQLFFPLSGHLVYYSRLTGRIRPLAGADEPSVVQTSPAWSPDGETITYARGTASEGLWAALGDQNLLDAAPGENIHTLNRKYPMRFDLWQVPFNHGAGGTAKPLTGAGSNGKSNYFPRYTPDGRWIVFCQSDSGLVSQPGSRLMILPSSGGIARTMTCNRPELNSWHSFSPNGRWMVFSSKPDDSPYTRVYLTHLDGAGLDTPAVLLHRIGTPGFAASLPEAVGLPERAFTRVRLAEP
ncbi:MAG: TolB family protein [Desulfobacterales bacterium]